MSLFLKKLLEIVGDCVTPYLADYQLFTKRFSDWRDPLVFLGLSVYIPAFCYNTSYYLDFCYSLLPFFL